MSLVTMFTDASWHRATHVGVWAMWAKYDGATIRYSGKIKDQMPQIGTAELAAIANGLFCVAKQFDCLSCATIICQTDCQEAIDAINRSAHPRQEDRAIVAHIKEFARTHGWRLDLRHVKGHRGTATPRNAVNTWCDRECHRQMGLALAQRQPKALKLVVDNTKAA